MTHLISWCVHLMRKPDGIASYALHTEKNILLSAPDSNLLLTRAKIPCMGSNIRRTDFCGLISRSKKRYCALPRYIFTPELIAQAEKLLIEAERLAAKQPDILKRVAGCEIALPERTTFYGMREIVVREPGGHLVCFAAKV